ncbi:MAG: hypothetical protein KDC38_18665 [Planctomycetes bacterium]|nr:hypothetical protein [Planctomycetota bacterium]
MSTPRPSTRQLIQEYLETKHMEGEPPTVREIAAAVGLKSPSSVQKHLKALERDGVILQGGRGRSRSWRLAAFASPPESIPVIGRIESGSTRPDASAEASLPFNPQAFAPSGRVHAYQVTDDDLVHEGILAGDYLLFHVPANSEPSTNGSTVGGPPIAPLLERFRRKRRLRIDPGPRGALPAPVEDGTAEMIAVLRLC